jgi:hypothetical protein
MDSEELAVIVDLRGTLLAYEVIDGHRSPMSTNTSRA